MKCIASNKVEEVYFTGIYPSGQGDLSVQYHYTDSQRIRSYYPDFLAKMKDGTYQLIEVKGDTKIDDRILKAKVEAATEVAIAADIQYKCALVINLWVAAYCRSRLPNGHKNRLLRNNQ